MIEYTKPIRVSQGDIVRSGDYAQTTSHTAVVTIPASPDPNKVTLLLHVQWSYSDTPTGGKITATEGSAVLWEHHITSGGPGGLSPDVLGTAATAMVVTLAAGGGSVIGRLTVRAVTVDPHSL
jgi:hypothetical protein